MGHPGIGFTSGGMTGLGGWRERVQLPQKTQIPLGNDKQSGGT